MRGENQNLLKYVFQEREVHLVFLHYSLTFAKKLRSGYVARIQIRLLLLSSLFPQSLRLNLVVRCNLWGK